MATPRAAVILAAGKSTRMKSSRSKVLHHVGGRAMLSWVADLARSVGADKIVCVVGEGNADVRAHAESLGLDIAVQEPQQGTGHAVLCAKEALAGFEGNVAVLYADTPFVQKTTLERVFKSLERETDVTVLGFEPEEPGFYGRLITEDGELTAIVEARDASSFQIGMRQAMLAKGVTLRDPDTTYFSWDTAISADAEIGANVVFGPGVSIAKHAVIHPFCHLEGAKIGEGAQIGPFARLRPGTEMAAGTKAGNFVETKKVKIGKGAYLGSGGVITKDVPADALAVARSEQVNKEGWAKRYNAAQKKRKAKK